MDYRLSISWIFHLVPCEAFFFILSTTLWNIEVLCHWKKVSKRIWYLLFSFLWQESVNWSQKEHTSKENKYSHPSQQTRHRRRRQSDDETSCHLFLQADHTYWEHFNKGNLETATAEVIAAFNDHVSHVSQIFSQENFGGWLNLDFIIDRIRVRGQKKKKCLFCGQHTCLIVLKPVWVDLSEKSWGEWK